jgi:hypothetical protein
VLPRAVVFEATRGEKDSVAGHATGIMITALDLVPRVAA